MHKTDLSKYNNQWYDTGGGTFKRLTWYLVNAIFLNSAFPVGSVKIFFLKLFGARIGKGVVVKPYVNIKYPWNLKIGDHVWIGEGVWIDNLAMVALGNHVCLSQGAMLLCGNHNYKSKAFDLIVKEIKLQEGVWIGAKAVVCPGVNCLSHAVLSVGAVATHDLEAYTVYGGNPAIKIRKRISV
jgi:putative colanic acid biosynthesis acetyltransferase WcaF